MVPPNTLMCMYCTKSGHTLCSPKCSSVRATTVAAFGRTKCGNVHASVAALSRTGLPYPISLSSLAGITKNTQTRLVATGGTADQASPPSLALPPTCTLSPDINYTGKRRVAVSDFCIYTEYMQVKSMSTSTTHATPEPGSRDETVTK